MKTIKKSGFAQLDFFIAAFKCSLIYPPNKYLFSISECQNKFLDSDNLYSSSADSEQQLKLTISDSDLAIDLTGLTPVFKNDLWELFRDEKDGLVLALHHSPIVKQLRVDRLYQNGIITVDLSGNKGELPFPLDDLGILLTINWLAERGDLMFHASGVVLDGQGYAFLGKSGAGKSTIASALAECCEAEVLGEDQVILRWLDGQFWIFGTPWHRDINRCSPKGIPFSALYFLDRGMPVGKTALSPVEGVTRVLQTAFTPFYRSECMPKIMDTLSNLAQVVPMFTLHWPLDEDPSQYL